MWKRKNKVEKGLCVSDHMGSWAGEKTALKTTSVWFPQITIFSAKNKTEEEDVLAAGSLVQGRSLAVPVLGGHGAEALGVPARSHPSALVSPKCSTQGRNALPWLPSPMGGASTPSTMSSSHTAWLSPQHPTCHPVPAQCWRTDPLLVPALRHQPASVPSLSTPAKGCVTLSPP